MLMLSLFPYKRCYSEHFHLIEDAYESLMLIRRKVFEEQNAFRSNYMMKSIRRSIFRES